MSVPTNVRFPADVDVALTDYARRAGSPKSTVVVEALGEWLRMQTHPGVVFVTATTGERRAALVGGPEVWTVAEAWRQHVGSERDPGVVADTLGLTRRQVEAALTYWAENRAEIDLVIEQHERDQNAALAAWSRRRELDGL